jgi:hypothetical protein
MSFTLLGILNSQAAGAGAAPAFDLLSTTLLGGNTTTVTLSGINAYTDYSSLQIRWSIRNSLSSTSQRDMNVLLNGQAAGTYHRHGLNNDGGGANPFYNFINPMVISNAMQGFSGTGAYGFGVMDIYDFGSSNNKTTMRIRYGILGDDRKWSYLYTSVWEDQSSLSTMAFTPDGGSFQAGSRFSIYGRKSA